MTTSEEYLRNNSQRVLWALALAYLVFVIYGSLVPLRLVPIPLDQAFTKFKEIPFLDLGIGSRADWVANLLLFIPLSMLWGQILLSRQNSKTRRVIRLLLVVTFVALACSIEFIQIFFPQRTVSQNDIIAESLGGILGLVAQAFWGNRLQELIGSLWQKENQANRLNRLLHAYLLLLVAFSVLPLDLTISPVEIYHKWAEGKVVLFPFSGLKGNLFESLYETLTDIIIWIPPGIMWMLSRRQSLARIALHGFLAGLVLETAQLFVYSRVSDVTDILLASVGALLGALFAKTTVKLRLTTPQLKPSFWFMLWIVWLISTFGIFWFPFDFRSTNHSITEAFSEIARVPFITYYYGTEFHAVNELLRKIGFFLPGGLLWGFLVSATKKNVLRKQLTVTGLLLIGLTAFGIEIGQVFLPQKTADITDVFLEFFGGSVGLSIAYWLFKPIEKNDSSPCHPQKNIAAIQQSVAKSNSESFFTRKTEATSKFSTRWIDLVPIGVSFIAMVNLLQSISFTQLPLVWKILSITGIILSAASHRIPVTGLLAYIIVAYGLPRYSAHYLLIMASGVLTWISVIAIVGTLIYASRHLELVKRFKDPILITMLIFFGWIFASWLNSTLSNSLQIADIRHHPVLFLHSLLLLLIASFVKFENKSIHFFTLVLTITPLLRWLLQGHEATYLDGDLPAIAAMVMPFALLGAWFATRNLYRIGYALIFLLLVGLIGYAQNRAAGVALAIGFLFILGHLNRKFIAITVAGFVFALAIFILPVNNYFARYSVIWNPEASHPTANLDRSTIKERLELWESGVEMARDYPVFGIGPGNYANLIPIYRIGKDNLVAHNSLLSLAAETGFFSLAAYLLAFILAFIRTKKIKINQNQAASVFVIAVQASLLAQFVAGMFVTRHDQVLQYILFGVIISLFSTHRFLSFKQIPTPTMTKSPKDAAQ